MAWFRPFGSSFALACLWLLGTAAAAQAPASVDAPLSPSRAVDAQIADYLNRSPAPDASPVLLPAADGGPAAAPATDKAPHGVVELGFGSDGYRHASASMIAPIGDVGTAAAAISDTSFQGRRGGAHRFQSLSVAVAVGPGMGNGAAATDCVRAPDGRPGSEPLWVVRLRAAVTNAGPCAGKPE